MTPYYYISGPHKVRNGFRVTIKLFTGDMNRLDQTIREDRFRTEAQAQKTAEEWKRVYEKAGAP